MFWFFLINIFLFGCATPTAKVVSFPDVPNHTLRSPVFKIYDVDSRKFIAENRKNSISKDNVTVTVEDITEVMSDERFSTVIEGPEGKSYKVGITPKMLVLNVKNDTNHIITLRQTIIKIEDENQNDYPLISNIPDAKNELRKRVDKAFDDYFEQIENSYKEVLIDNDKYQKDYEVFVTELKTGSKQPGGVRTPDLDENKFLTQAGVDSYIKSRSPEYLYELNIKPFRDEILPLKAKAGQKIYNDIDNNINNIITSGVYPAISLIPGRITKIVVPFNTRSSSENISSLFVNIFDVPTEVDAASNPIKREHFSFKLVAQN